jgi:hypothetical protein
MSTSDCWCSPPEITLLLEEFFSGMVDVDQRPVHRTCTARHDQRWTGTVYENDRRYLRRFDLARSSPLLFNHTVRYNNERDLELYALLQPGEDSVHALERYGRPDPDLMRYRSDVFDDKYARLRGDKPCKTIVSHLAKDGNGYIHPSQTRSISIREARTMGPATPCRRQDGVMTKTSFGHVLGSSMTTRDLLVDRRDLEPDRRVIRVLARVRQLLRDAIRRQVREARRRYRATSAIESPRAFTVRSSWR